MLVYFRRNISLKITPPAVKPTSLRITRNIESICPSTLLNINKQGIFSNEIYSTEPCKVDLYNELLFRILASLCSLALFFHAN